MSNFKIDEITESLSAPLGEFISSIAKGVADAQQAMDQRTIEAYMEIYKKDDAFKEALRQIGYQPTWYKIPEVNAEIMMSLTIEGQSTIEGSTNPTASSNLKPLKIYAAPIDANYSNRFGFDIKGASKITFKIVPVPPSPRAEELKVVPNIVNKPLGEATSLLRMLGIDFLVNSIAPPERTSIGDARTIRSTNPEQGAILKPGQILNVNTSS